MSLDTFKTELHAIFENCDYTDALKENTDKMPFTYADPTGVVYNVEVNPMTKEYVVSQDGKQVDMFSPALLDKDGGVSKDVRQAIDNEWKRQEGGKTPEAINVKAPEDPVVDTAPAVPSTAQAGTPVPPAEPVVGGPGAPVPTQGLEQPVAEAAPVPPVPAAAVPSAAPGSALVPPIVLPGQVEKMTETAKKKSE
jgi:hypothetical protein